MANQKRGTRTQSNATHPTIDNSGLPPQTCYAEVTVQNPTNQIVVPDYQERKRWRDYAILCSVGTCGIIICCCFVLPVIIILVVFLVIYFNMPH